MDNTGIISQGRVKRFGEVFTPDKIVNDMLDLVDSNIDTSIDKYLSTTFLEPSCGDGQFLIRILSRKLEMVKNMPLESRQLGLIKSLASIYAVDIQADNVAEAQMRLFKLATGEEITTFDLGNKIKTIRIELGIEYTEQLKNVIWFILKNNILVGNTLETGELIDATKIEYNYLINNSKKFVTPETIIFVDYEFNGEYVVLKQCPLFDLNIELRTYDKIEYMNMHTIILENPKDIPVNPDCEDEDADFDF